MRMRLSVAATPLHSVLLIAWPWPRRAAADARTILPRVVPAPGASLGADRGDASPNCPPAPLDMRMSRSSPGRYAVTSSRRTSSTCTRSTAGHGADRDPAESDQWDVAGHDGTVRIVYKMFGDRVDGTYLAIDTTHAHMNMPATLMWARGLDRPAGSRHASSRRKPLHGRRPPSSFRPTTRTFTAPNLQYLMDSPTELSAQSMRTFTVRNPDGRQLDDPHRRPSRRHRCRRR